MSKKVVGRYDNNRGHWVGDGFPVRSLFSYQELGTHISPFVEGGPILGHSAATGCRLRAPMVPKAERF